jgi:predicted transporter
MPEEIKSKEGESIEETAHVISGWVFLVLGGISNFITGAFNMIRNLGEAIGGFQVSYILSSTVMLIGIFLLLSGYIRKAVNKRKQANDIKR